MLSRRRFIESTAFAALTGMVSDDASAQDLPGATINFEFVGLCAFVPYKELLQTGIRVGMINAKYFHHLRPKLHDHLPILAVRDDALAPNHGGTEVPYAQLQRWRKGTQGRYYMWTLAGRDTRVKVAKSDPLGGNWSRAVPFGEALKRALDLKELPPLKEEWWLPNKEVVTGSFLIFDGDRKNGGPRKDNNNYKFHEAEWTYQPYHQEPLKQDDLCDAFVCKTKNVTSIDQSGSATMSIKLKDHANSHAFVVNLPSCPMPHNPKVIHHVRAYYALYKAYDRDTPYEALAETPVPRAIELEKSSGPLLPEGCPRNEGDVYCPGGGP